MKATLSCLGGVDNSFTYSYPFVCYHAVIPQILMEHVSVWQALPYARGYIQW